MRKQNSTSVSSGSFQSGVKNSLDFDPDAAFRPMLSPYYSTRPDQNCVSDEGRREA
jgi:hypothetical protein